jgi:hypothetical protein
MAQLLITEDLLQPGLAARLCFCKGLHERLAADSPAAAISADLFDQILAFVVKDPVDVPGTKAAGAHTNNPSYYEYKDDALVLKTVCWLHVGIGAEAVPRGRYAITLELSTGPRPFKLPTTVTVRPARAAHGTADGDAAAEAPWVECCAPYTWAPGVQARGMLCLGEVTLAVASDIRVTQLNTDGGWKGGTIWHKLSLVPLSLSAPAVEQGWDGRPPLREPTGQ